MIRRFFLAMLVFAAAAATLCAADSILAGERVYIDEG